MSSVGLWAKPVEEAVQLIHSVQAVCLSNWSQLFPSSKSTRLLCCFAGVWPHPPPVGVLGPPQLCLQVTLYSPNFLLVSWLEALFWWGPVVWEAANSFGWQGGVFTEFDVFCNAVSPAINVLPKWITKYFPVSRLKTVLQSLLGLLIPPPNCPCGGRLLLNKKNILWCQKKQVVIRSSQWAEGIGTARVLCICIQGLFCSIVFHGAVY